MTPITVILSAVVCLGAIVLAWIIAMVTKANKYEKEVKRIMQAKCPHIPYDFNVVIDSLHGGLSPGKCVQELEKKYANVKKGKTGKNR